MGRFALRRDVLACPECGSRFLRQRLLEDHWWAKHRRDDAIERARHAANQEIAAVVNDRIDLIGGAG